MTKKIFFIGGSPCSGKSTIADIISKKYGLYYYKTDDFLENFTKIGVKKGYKICSKQIEMNAENIWMREPSLQCSEELTFYREIFDLIMDDLSRINSDLIITEGAAYLPELIRKAGIPDDRYISITPTKEFQIFHYSKREWVPYVLAECSDKEKAFSNWMERDVLFAEEVRKQCREEKYTSIINDGNTSIDKLVCQVTSHFKTDAYCIKEG